MFKAAKISVILLITFMFTILPCLSVRAGSENSAGTIANKSTEIYAYVGSRTTKERNARGEGINVYKVDLLTGNWVHVQLVKTPQENPSFLAFDRQENYLYSVHGDFSEVSSYKIDKKTGQLTFLNMQSTQGKNPVHLVTDPSNNFLVVANYATGSLVSLPIRDDGSLAPLVDLVKTTGKNGPHNTQQASSHPHQTLFDIKEKFILVPDKGLDKTFTFTIDSSSGKLSPGNPSSVVAREGAAPRHITFHPNLPYAYVANELDSTITTYSYDSQNGQLQPLQIIPSIPETFTGNNTASEIMITPSGNFVYISNRGHDSIGVYSVNKSTGRLSPIDWVSSQGKGPRFFSFDPTGKYLYPKFPNWV